MIGIYKITSPSKKVYIGQSIDIQKRFKQYKSLYKSKGQIALHNSFVKYGIDKHKFEVLSECEESELNDKERYYQDVFSVIGKNGLNCKLTKSSDRNGKHSEETKIKMSEAKKGKKMPEDSKKKLSESRKGIIFSKEHKLKMSISSKGKKKSKETIKERYKIILNLETGIFYYGQKEASESICIKIGKLNACLNGYNPNKTPFIYV